MLLWLFHESLLFLLQATRPEAFPHPHRLPAEGSRIGTNRPCSQVSASPFPARCYHSRHILRTCCTNNTSSPLLHLNGMRCASSFLNQSTQQVYFYTITHWTVQSAAQMQGNACNKGMQTLKRLALCCFLIRVM